MSSGIITVSMSATGFFPIFRFCLFTPLLEREEFRYCNATVNKRLDKVMSDKVIKYVLVRHIILC